MKPEVRVAFAKRIVVDAEAAVARQRQLVKSLKDVGGAASRAEIQAEIHLRHLEETLKNARRTVALLKATLPPLENLMVVRYSGSLAVKSR